MTSTTRRIAAVLLAAGAALVIAASASAHAVVSPKLALANAGQLFTLAVPAEKLNLTTTTVELTVPQGFTIDSFVPARGWKHTSVYSASEQVPAKVIWTGGSVPQGEDAAFQFIATPDATRTYTFSVRQTYSDGSVVDWSGPESSDTPAPTIKVVGSLGGGGSSTLAIVALVVAAVGVLIGIAALSFRAGGRPLA
jgi:uncharacterized protein YcnI